MPDPLSPEDFTTAVVHRLAPLKLDVSVLEPLRVQVIYGENEPQLTLQLQSLYDQYLQAPDNPATLVEPLVTEVGWTVNGTFYSFNDIAHESLPLLRDLIAQPFSADGEDGNGGNPKGPILYQELVNRPDEHVVVQLVLAKNEMVRPLYTGDMLRSYPEPAAFAGNCVKNLRSLVVNVGLTLSEFAIDGFAINPFLVGLRGGKYRQFQASLITVPEVMMTLQQTLKAPGITAIIPTREQLLVSPSVESEAAIQMGLLARHLRADGGDPVSGCIWHFKDGLLSRVQTIEAEG